MIEQWLKMQLMGMFQGAFGGIFGGGGGGGGGGAFNIGLGAFAEGGYVTGPTAAMVGEGGEPEYVIPSSKMNEAMGRYSSGKRGDDVIPGKNESGGNSGSGSGGVTQVNYTGPTLSFNGDDYVPRSAVPDLINAAAAQGAKEGERRTMKTLQHSPGARRKLGMK